MRIRNPEKYEDSSQGFKKRVRYGSNLDDSVYTEHRTDHIRLILSKQNGSKICQFQSFHVHVEPTYSVADQDPGSGTF
jgi:hypothetical protein